LYNFTFENPYFFLLLFLILCIYKCPLKIKQIIFPHTKLFQQLPSYLDKSKLLYSFIFALLVTALASPISYDTKLSSRRKGRDVVFVLDASGSMGEVGYSKKNEDTTRFQILKNIINDFIIHRYDDNVGVVVFGSYAYATVPLTYDMKSVAFLLDFLTVGIAGENTAIGDGLSQAIRLLKRGNAKSKVIILVTDGYQNSGSIPIKDAVKKAKKEHLKIYTIGMGKRSNFDLQLLKKIAKETEAKIFSAASEEELTAIYDELDTLEPSKIHSKHYLNKHTLFTYPLAFAILLLLYLLEKRRAL
jgi:Ca-activated chloride channel family protein